MKDNDPQTNVKEIVAAFNAGRHSQARRLCETALAASPNDPVLQHLHANICLILEDYESALRSAGDALVGRPGNAAARLIAGKAARALGDIDAAAAFFREAVPSKPEARLELARTLELAGRRAEARDVWHDIRRLDPTSREAAARLGRCLWEESRFSEAREALEFAAAADAPASAWFDLALARHDTGDLEGAVEAYRVALQRDPDDAQTAFNLAVILQDLARMDEAIASYRRAYALSHATLGMIANALTSGATGRLFLDSADLKAFLAA